MTLFSSVPGTFVLAVGVVMTGVVAPSVVAQAPPGSQGIDTLTSTRDSLLVTYEEGATVVVELEGTSRLPEGEGRAEVRRRPGVTEIDIRLDKMKPATLFGGDFSTYVLWTVSPEGRAVNVGEFLLDSEESELRVSSPLDMFGLFVTAEPHALVTMPSRFVVLDNTGVGVQRGRTTTRSVQYQGFDGVYEFERESLLRQPAARGRQRVERQQAVIAVALAERAGAATYAPDELRTAADALGRTVAAFERGASQAERTLLAHETVRLAMGAREVAVTRAAEAALEAERQAARDEIDALARARQEAEAAAARVQALRAEAQREAEEAKAAATQLTQLRDEAETQAERDRLAAEDARQAQQAAVSAQAAAEAATREAQLEQQAARALAEQAQLESARLEDLRAEAETQAERDRLAAADARQAQQAAVSAQAAAEAATREAQLEQQAARALAEQAQLESARLEDLRAEAETQAERARREAADARTRMENALGRVADTQQTARGVIVNLSDILFETGQAVLRPQAREVLSRIAGVLLVAPTYALSIEGHTDAVGSDDYNQQLSERRAASVRDYLAEAQVSPDVMRTAGFGKARPVATNDTPDGRQRNRRVEIVIQNDDTPGAE